MATRDVLVTGGTGYLGSRLVARLVADGHRVRVLARSQSLGRVANGATPTVGDPLDASSVASALRSGDTLVHLVGTPHPSPAKATEFLRIDLPSIQASVAAATRVGVDHFIYVSVAHPAPIMRAYIAVRQEGERLIAAAGLTATVLRPWYVLGPGHRWPMMLVPVYAVASWFPSFRDGATRLGLVTVDQMTAALVHAVDHSPSRGTTRVVGVADIRSRAAAAHSTATTGTTA